MGRLRPDPDDVGGLDVLGAAELGLDQTVVLVVDDAVEHQRERRCRVGAVQVRDEGRLGLTDEAVGLIGPDAALDRHHAA